MYSTELMEQRLTSEIGQQIIQRVTNKYGNSYVGLWLFQIIGMSNDEVKAMVEDFKNQTLPQTATWSLSLWEQSMGLPVNESESVEQRRQNIIEKRRRRNAMNPARIEEIISAMIFNNRCFISDESSGRSQTKGLHGLELPSRVLMADEPARWFDTACTLKTTHRN